MRARIARPETAACAGRPRWAWPEASAAAAPPTQNTSANAAIASAVARRPRSGRSGKDGLQRHADDLHPPGEAVEGELAQIVLADAEHLGCVAVARELERLGDVGEEVAQRLAHDLGRSFVFSHRLAQPPDAE